MAELRVDNGELELVLSPAEKALGAHRDLRVPLSAVQSVEVLDNAHEPADHGFKVGERLPGVSEIGSIHDRGKTIFAAVHHDTPRGILVRLSGVNYDEWVVGCADPEGVASAIVAGR